MKVGTDGVLLGAWVPLVPSDGRVVDVGTGTGLLALMLAQRFERWGSGVRIDAVEIDSGAALEAQDNVHSSPWADRIAVYNEPFQQFASRGDMGCYDLVISNPPYFIADSHRDGRQAIAEPARLAARHACLLSYRDLVCGAVELLRRPGGRLTVILPYDESSVFAAEAIMAGLFPTSSLEVRSTPGKEIRRVITEYTLFELDAPRPSIAGEQIVISQDSAYSERYREITRDFYLDF